jgi:hypothetical protein
MVRDPGVCALVRNIMIEVEALANQRIAGAEKMGGHISTGGKK